MSNNLLFNTLTDSSFFLKCCPICSSNSIKFLFDKDTINPQSDKVVSFFKCLNCFHWFLNPMPSQSFLSELYSENSPFVVGDGFIQEVGDKRLVESKFFHSHVSFWFTKHIDLKACGYYLEIGIGSGHVFNYFNKLGWNCHGIEPGPWRPLNANVVSDISKLSQKLQFDLIVANDVIEHLEDPSLMVKQLSSFLTKEGLLCLSVPYCSSFRAFLMGRNWRCVRPLGHVHFFSKKSMHFLASNAGLKIVFYDTSELF